MPRQQCTVAKLKGLQFADLHRRPPCVPCYCKEVPLGGMCRGGASALIPLQFCAHFSNKPLLSVTVTPTLRAHTRKGPFRGPSGYSAALNGHFSQRSSPSRQLSRQIPASAHSLSVGQQIFTHSGFATGAPLLGKPLVYRHLRPGQVPTEPESPQHCHPDTDRKQPLPGHSTTSGRIRQAQTESFSGTPCSTVNQHRPSTSW